MTNWYAPLAGTGEVTVVDPTEITVWPENAFAEILPSLSFCPIGFSEAMLLSQNLPLSLAEGPFGYELVADLKTFPCFTTDGQWRLGYKPLALRLLPFHVNALGHAFQIKAAPDVAVQEQPEQARQEMAHLLSAYQDERARATRLVQRIVKAGWIAPDENVLDPLQPGPIAAFFDKLQLTKDRAGPFQLFTTIAFSQKNHRRKAPLFEMMRNQQKLSPGHKTSSSDDFTSFLDFGEAVKW